MAIFNAEAFKKWLESDGSVKFDLYAQDIDEWAFLQELIPGIIISSAGGMMPFQAEGLLGEYPFYFRAEQGSCSIKLGDPNSAEKPYLLGNSLYYAKADCDVHSFEDFIYCLTQAVPKLERSPFLWKFKARKFVSFNPPAVDAEEWDEVIGWGHTPDEGYLAALEPSPYLVSVGVSEEAQVELWALQEVESTPLNEDLRVWPEVDPVFEVKL